jgi:hypothetical protein
MTDTLRADNRLRAILSSWYRRPRYRPEVQHQFVPSSRQTELNRESERGSRFVGQQSSLIVLTIVDYFYLQHWR